jgi:hypothetical protein
VSSTGGFADLRSRFLVEIGVEAKQLDSFAGRLAEAYNVDEWGFQQLGAIEDVGQRAVVSDQILTAADAIATNLIEARVHLRDFEEMTAAGEREAREIDHLATDTRIDLHVVGFFRAFGSTLDCLAAVAVGILRLPRSIHRTSMTALMRLKPAAMQDEQQRARVEEMQELIRDAGSKPVAGWLEWAIEHRNALVHRPRQIDFMVPRRTHAVVVLANPSEWLDLVRYDLHLRSKPWLPDLQHLATPEPKAEELLLAEPAGETMAGLFEQLNAFSERFASWLVGVWDRIEARELTLEVPVDSWKEEPDIEIEFAGFQKKTLNAGDLLRGHPLTTMRLELAERVRRKRGG